MSWRVPACVTDARNALAFLSRLVPPASAAEDSPFAPLSRAVPYYPMAGLVLGGIACIPLLLPLPIFITAWLYALILAWTTRGLHWDGLADLADACGSNATGDRFWEILKDSRIGAFGVMALVFGIGGQVAAVAAVAACLEKGAWLPLLLAPVYGRGMVILFGRLVKPNERSTLAALIQPGITSFAAFTSLVIVFALTALCLDTLPFLACLSLTGVILYVLRRIALAHDGANGDFHGTVIVTSEIAVLVSAVLG
ncbi:MAG: Adenosylcobinamide-GDP ribazoletransferase [Desulfovibrio sp.]